MRLPLLLALLLLPACRRDYVQMSRELGTQEVVDPRPPIVEKQHTYYDRDTARPRLETTYRIYPGGRKVRHGVEREWYSSGQLHWEREFADGEPTGRWSSYYPDGTRESETWPGPDPTPRTTTWWHSNGAVSSTGPSVRGVRHGHWTSYYSDGALESEGEYVAGRREGQWAFWNQDGSSGASGIYRAGQRVGDWLRKSE